LCLCVVGCLAVGQDFLVDDFEGAETQWRSKFGLHEVMEGQRAGQKTKFLKMGYDFREGPRYTWVRAMLRKPLDVRQYRYLSFWVRGDGSKNKVTAVLIKRVPPEAGKQHGEMSVAAGQRWFSLEDTKWRQLSIPLSAFQGDREMMQAVEQVNFSVQAVDEQQTAGSIELDEVRLMAEQPAGEVVEEQVPFPPADIAIKSEADFFGALDLERPELKDVKAAVARQDWPAAKAAWARHLEAREQPRWFFSYRDRDRLVQVFDEHFGGLKRAVPAADRALARDFTFLGVHKKLEHDMQWLHGPLEWTHVLSRFGYWTQMGQAYWATGDEKYADDFVFVLRDWIKDNPVPRICTNSRGKHGTVWRTLETGIRADLWFEVMQYFMPSPAFDAEVKYEMTRSLVEHARHLHRYEVGFRYGNWQVVECAGLACIGVMLPEFREASAWRERAYRYLAEHMEKDVYPDGSHHELTPGYHGWVRSKFLRAARIAQINHVETPDILGRHEKMYEFWEKLCTPDRRTPPVGDSGRNYVGNELGLAALLYHRPDFRFLGADKASAGWVWLLGPSVIEDYAKIEARPPDFTSCLLPDAKYCMMRSGWEPDATYGLFDCAPWGGGHSHADRLQFTLFAGGNRLILDSGQISYDNPVSGQYFRRSRAHSILMIDGREQPTADPELLKWVTTPEFDFAAGRLVDEKRRIAQTRTVLFVKPEYFVVVDHVGGEGTHRLEQLWHLPDGEHTVAPKMVRTGLKTGANAVLAWPGEGEVSEQTGYLPGGDKLYHEAPVAVFTREGPLPAVLPLVIAAVKGEAEGPQVEQYRLDGQVALLRVRSGTDCVDEFALAPEVQELALGQFRCKARAAWVRTDGGKVSRIAIAGE